MIGILAVLEVCTLPVQFVEKPRARQRYGQGADGGCDDDGQYCSGQNGGTKPHKLRVVTGQGHV